MSKPTTSLAKMLEAERADKERTTLFQSDRDFKFLNKKALEQSEKVGATVHFIPVSSELDPKGEFESAGVDELYGDILDPEFQGNPDGKDQRRLNIRCIIEHEPPKQLLKRYGIDEQREVVFYVPFEEFVREGVVSKWRPHGADIGDLFIWDGTWYQAWNVYRDHYFGQRAKAHFIACFANRYRHNAAPTEDIPTEDS